MIAVTRRCVLLQNINQGAAKALIRSFSYSPLFSIAPMMDYTDRHQRYFMRLLTKKGTSHHKNVRNMKLYIFPAVLYTEMVTANAVVHRPDVKLIESRFDVELPVVLQVKHNIYD